MGSASTDKLRLGMVPLRGPMADFSSLLMGPDLTFLHRGEQQAGRLSFTVSSWLPLCSSPTFLHPLLPFPSLPPKGLQCHLDVFETRMPSFCNHE